MPIYQSPNVYTVEADLTNQIASLSTTTGAIVGASNQGDPTAVRLMTNTQQFIAQYGEPVVGNYFHYSALAYLANGNQLYCLRLIGTNCYYGGVEIQPSSSVLSNSTIAFNATTPNYVFTSGVNSLFQIYGVDPGTWNNNIGIQISNVISPTPTTIANGTAYTFVITVLELQTNGTYSVVESWTVSRQQQVDGYGNQQYLMSAINSNSQYIRVADNTLWASTVLPKVQSSTLALAGGANGSAITDAAYGTLGSGTGWDLFSNVDNFQVNILIGAGVDATVQTVMKSVAENRKDCIALFDVPYSTINTSSSSATATNCVSFRTVTQNINSSYCALYAPWANVYDSYNGVIVPLPPSGYVASQIAYNDFVANVWYAPAGLNRGLLNVLSVTPIFSQGDRDLLYENGINPIQTFRGAGTAIWGQKTLQYLDSALNRVNVRRLFLTLEKAIGTALKGFVFEPNSDTTRFRITAMIDQYLNQLSASGAFQTELGDKGYKIICNITNNTPSVIDSNELIVDVFIKPSRAAEFIVLRVTAVPTGVTFQELLSNGVNL